jgi:glycosyltransferase involved in cell wall biosynthesis
MIRNWVTFGMSAFYTPGFQDTSRLMTSSWSGSKTYVEPPKPFSAWKKLDGKILGWTKASSEGVDVYQPPLPFPSKLDPFSWHLALEAKSFDREMRSSIGEDWRDTSVVYITNWTPYLQPLISRIKAKYLVVDFVDDVLKFPYNWDVQRVTEQYQRLVEKAAAVIGVSPTLKEYVEREFAASCTILPNGVNQIFFTPSSSEPPKGLDGVSGKLRVGFAGTLNHWIDYEGIFELANTYPEHDYILMGKRGHLSDREQAVVLERLSELGNVSLLGPVLYEELPNYLHHMDVLLLPRVPSQSSEASSPLKLYEYLAVGKPIVTSGFPLVPQVKDLVYHSESSQGLVDSIRSAIMELESDRAQDLTKRRQAFARENTWEQRLHKIVRLLDS